MRGDDRAPVVELLGRPGCHLCEALWPELVAAARGLGLEARRVDIEQEPGLLRTFLWRIPVVRVGPRVVAEGRVDPAMLGPVLGAAIGHEPVRSRSRRRDNPDAAPGGG
ncbi:MAG TPA: glutaredoxin family protein [Verrucomicrobiae bacterium]|nr:glutaredoxin family protein [Verrucomicrobiae bacterium]